MTKDTFGILGMSVLATGWLLGVFAAGYADSLVVVAAVAFGVPTTTAMICAKPITRAWWSANRQEAAQSDFGSEAKTSLWFVVFISIGLAVIMGAYAFARESIYWSAFTGSLFALSAFAVARLRDLAARNFQ